MESKLHRMVISIFVAQFLISILAVFGKQILNLLTGMKFNVEYFSQFIGDKPEDFKSIDSFSNNLLDGFRYFLLLTTMIPISLLVNLEVVRALQIMFMKCNKGLKSEERDIKCSANNTSINEELGEVNYIMTDKTGTLTKNKMTL